MNQESALIRQRLRTPRASAIAGVIFSLGTWKLKEAKSEFFSGAPKIRTVVYEAEGDKVKVAVDSVSGDGKPTHYVWVGKFDGKEYPVTGDPLSDARSYTVVDEHILGFNIMKGRKVITSGRIVVSADGKNPHGHHERNRREGHRVSSSEVYEELKHLKARSDKTCGLAFPTSTAFMLPAARFYWLQTVRSRARHTKVNLNQPRGSGGSTSILIPCGLGRFGNRSVGTASSLASRCDRIVGVMISTPASAKASNTLRRRAAYVSKIPSEVLVQARSSYPTK
jgi:hypothetical protein